MKVDELREIVKKYNEQDNGVKIDFGHESVEMI